MGWQHNKKFKMRVWKRVCAYRKSTELNGIESALTSEFWGKRLKGQF